MVWTDVDAGNEFNVDVNVKNNCIFLVINFNTILFFNFAGEFKLRKWNLLIWLEKVSFAKLF